jgi:hypothetical protein
VRGCVVQLCPFMAMTISCSLSTSVIQVFLVELEPYKVRALLITSAYAQVWKLRMWNISGNPILPHCLTYVRVLPGVVRLYFGTGNLTVNFAGRGDNGTIGFSAALEAFCPAGTYFAANTGLCTSCADGTWSEGLYQASPCTLRCSAGYACPAGSSSGTASVCLPGTYSEAGAGSCTDCAAGRWSDARARTTPCVDECTAGYYCPPASASPTVRACPAGKYSGPGASACTDCASGRWSNELARWAPCNASCPAGYACPAGSSSQGLLCPPGSFSAAGADTCSPYVCPESGGHSV